VHICGSAASDPGNVSRLPRGTILLLRFLFFEAHKTLIHESNWVYTDDDEDKIAFYSDVEVLSMFSFFKTKCNSDTAKIFVEGFIQFPSPISYPFEFLTEEPSPGQHGARATNPKLEHNYFTRSTNRPAALQANVKVGFQVGKSICD
jgi:hypothetical protein